MAKKATLLFLLLLVACMSNSSDIPSSDSFEISAKCPNICWLGIQPGVTTPEQARILLRASNKIDQSSFQGSDTELQIKWFTEKTKTYYSHVWLFFDGNVVQSIRFTQLAPFKVKNIVSMFGEPNLIIIRLEKTIDGGNLVEYAAYLSSIRVSFSVDSGYLDEPNSQDYVATLALNTEFIYSKFFKDEKPQPWLGYGRLKEYLPGIEIPVTIEPRTP